MTSVDAEICLYRSFRESSIVHVLSLSLHVPDQEVELRPVATFAKYRYQHLCDPVSSRDRFTGGWLLRRDKNLLSQMIIM
jgi:hypothetical protein